ncbi:hypothetical protein PVBG_06007 [Plasmodium vivax Brazil I]|uniref:Variable surface protein n=1 Tax=Plasmodium vivax (strain Brazil I) TaxID=1033975 RepID=A0A0J9SZQ8_PLAV1|nr:hypothetical protein PVBG_06007 [Plasmodium vivax Brazil I]
MRNGLNICFKRYLAEYEGETRIDKTGLNKSSPYYFENNETSNYHDYVSTYRNMKNSDSKKLKLYKTSYKHRYSKKKGLEKLDCYCEKILFDKFDYLHKIAENRKNRRTSFIDKILNKYGYRLILFSLLPIIGLIFPVLFCGKDEKNESSIFFCIHEKHEGSSEDCKLQMLPKSILPHIYVITYISLVIFYFIIPTIYLSMIIYGFIKVVKYEKLKSGKDKMSFNEYCRFCKGLFYLN